MRPRFCSEAELSAQCAQDCSQRCSPYFRWKGALDRLLAAVLLAPGGIAVLIIVMLVRLSSRGPGIYRQRRVGYRGKIFTIYKIRTMHQNAEGKTGAVWTTSDDPRITWLGRHLRKLHLDELPQLWNVLRGEMSLVGPRPERPEFVAALMEEIPQYCLRLAVPPGVTGLAQINLPPDTDLESVRRKQALDVLYIDTASLWLDLRMIVCTSLRAIGVSGARATRLLRLERTVPLPGPAIEPLPSPEPTCAACTDTLPEISLQTLQDTQTISADVVENAVHSGDRPAACRSAARVLLNESGGNGNGNGNGKAAAKAPTKINTRVDGSDGRTTPAPGKPR